MNNKANDTTTSFTITTQQTARVNTFSYYAVPINDIMGIVLSANEANTPRANIMYNDMKCY